MKNNKNNGFVRNSFIYILLIIAGITAFQYYLRGTSTQSQQINYSTLIKQIKAGDIKSITYQPSGSIIEVSGEYTKAQTTETSSSLPFLEGSTTSTVTEFTSIVLPSDSSIEAITNAAEDADVEVTVKQESSSGTWISYIITYIPFIVLIVFFFVMMNQGGNGARGAMSFGKNRAKSQSKGNVKVRFSDVAGAEEEKQELVEVVDFLKNPKKYKALGARIPAGVLLEGPPGTGKTLLAKAVAGEAGVPFFSISGSDFVEMFVGVGASRVRSLFEDAKKAERAIIFIDEIDAVGRRRGAGMGGGNDEREQTLNQLLIEMDGFEGNESIIVIAATNRSDVLDPALLRPGRFDRKILVGSPDVKGREAILRVHAKNKPLAEDVNLKVVAQQTPGFVGADLENVLNEAALVAARRNKKKIDASDIDEAEDRVIAGPSKKDRTISQKEREMVAYHEAGHTIVGLVLSSARVVHKVTIVPRGRAGGYMIALPKEDQMLHSKDDLKEQLAGLMGGRVAEEIIFNAQTTGASNDFEQATQLARAMVTEYGMSDKLGPVQYEGNHAVMTGQLSPEKTYSAQTAQMIDDEVRTLLNEARDKAADIINNNRETHKLIAEALLKYETLDAAQIKSIYETGKMPEELENDTEEAHALSYDEVKEKMDDSDDSKE
ncbi:MULTISPECIES: ATP-dependent zinc metalloprotease FtsH [Streptococcus]|uniref:ATP-dependent zinc metalloprotease FtsH n=1 Tax=Streptococcus gallolyticus TaxID=315405 RepID=A0A1I7INZ3_9STRE|nr:MULTISPECIES: ATP-dependent zinc metalloprotease FtsH [Streptococcus]MCO7178409.1 ATP-dependent zinc metalloprotease FtsH [Streptococcus gallolyticus]MCR5051596.1 ATP-dependent zinc metalloprotease FtsH [Streptococcus sp.]MCY7192079.1 ATP-dependent zinc metalloprotease FtsH [Streptococcus gallolyticus subsp. gallolyticus]WAW99071.1 ATP-dependent zinc metalloprotease FtsH [Streptococcus gallolyticus]SFC68863.1 membrane protease FtsH catalytic subunit [Streptococcus gallolyticus]